MLRTDSIGMGKDVVELPASSSKQHNDSPDRLTKTFGILPLPRDAPDPTVAAKLAHFDQLAETKGLYFNDSLAASKAFRNPHIYKKLVDFVDVDEACSQFDTLVWNPAALGSHVTSKRIGERQKELEEMKNSRPAGSRSSIAFTSSSSSTAGVNAPRDAPSAARRDGIRRRDADEHPHHGSRSEENSLDRRREPQRPPDRDYHHKRSRR